MSLKFKMILFGVLLTGTMLCLYGFLALHDFQKDKLAYVLDSSLSHSRATAMQVRTEINHTLNRIQILMNSYSYSTLDFIPGAKNKLALEKDFDALFVYRFNRTLGLYEKSGTIYKPSTSVDAQLIFAKEYERIPASNTSNEIEIIKSPEDANKWVLTVYYDQGASNTSIAIKILINRSIFTEIFDTQKMHDTYLLNSQNQVSIQSSVTVYNIPLKELQQAISIIASAQAAAEETHIYKSRDNSEQWLISLVSVGIGSLKIISLVPKSVALEAVRMLVVKSVLLILLLFFITVFVSILSSATLTASLKNLLEATVKISRGDFNVTIKNKAGGEIGALANGFEKMTIEIQRLLHESVEKTRMESELKTAQLVQSSLFPSKNLTAGSLKILGHYQPAGECSGDWWHYEVDDSKILIAIGDATGHGVSAALLTCAARSAATAVKCFPALSLSEIMNIFNHSIYNTASGNLLMTFFLGIYDKKTGALEYCNASHEPPYVLRNTSSKMRVNDIVFLNENINVRLGQELNTIFSTSTVQINPGDRIVLYTDGVTELFNPLGNMLGERKFINSLLLSKNNSASLEQSMTALANMLSDFRSDAPLKDDITYFMVERT